MTVIGIKEKIEKKKVLGDLCVPTCTHSLLNGYEHYSYRHLCDTVVGYDNRKCKQTLVLPKYVLLILY